MIRLRCRSPLALCGLLAAVLTVTTTVPVAAAIDPFYESLLRRGSDAFNRRDYQEAARLLRLACFGLLEDPEQLADGLTRLGLAQALASDAAGFRETFSRLEEVEELFSAWSSAPIPDAMRTAFRRQASRLIPAATLQTSLLTASTAEPGDEFAGLEPKERRKKLEKRIADEPREPRWRLMLARLDLDEGKIDAAIRGAEATLAVASGNPSARYVRGLALAAAGRWQEAVADLESSRLAAREPAGAAAMLQGLLVLGRSDEARTFLAGLGTAVAADPQVQAAAGAIEAR